MYMVAAGSMSIVAGQLERLHAAASESVQISSIHEHLIRKSICRYTSDRERTRLPEVDWQKEPW